MTFVEVQPEHRKQNHQKAKAKKKKNRNKKLPSLMISQTDRPRRGAQHLNISVV